MPEHGAVRRFQPTEAMQFCVVMRIDSPSRPFYWTHTDPTTSRVEAILTQLCMQEAGVCCYLADYTLLIDEGLPQTFDPPPNRML